MLAQLFVAARAAAAALLALWLHVRLPNLAPASVARAIAHLALSGVVLYCFTPRCRWLRSRERSARPF